MFQGRPTSDGRGAIFHNPKTTKEHGSSGIPILPIYCLFLSACGCLNLRRFGIFGEPKISRDSDQDGNIRDARQSEDLSITLDLVGRPERFLEIVG
jgi:hypothetical protein